jgi:hypothetical protein
MSNGTDDLSVVQRQLLKNDVDIIVEFAATKGQTKHFPAKVTEFTYVRNVLAYPKKSGKKLNKKMRSSTTYTSHTSLKKTCHV